MLNFGSIENLQLALLFVVPGVIALFVRSKFITGRTPSPTENILTFVVLSLVYYSLIVFVIERAFAVQQPWLAQAAVWILLILVGPAAFGLILGVAAQREWGDRLAHKFGSTSFM